MGKGASVENQEQRSDDFDAEHQLKLLAELRDLFAQLSERHFDPVYFSELPIQGFLRKELDFTARGVDMVIGDITARTTKYLLMHFMSDEERYPTLAPLFTKAYGEKETKHEPDTLLNPRPYPTR